MSAVCVRFTESYTKFQRIGFPIESRSHQSLFTMCPFHGFPANETCPARVGHRLQTESGEFYLNFSKKKWFDLYFFKKIAVCCPSEYSTITGRYLVRRSARFPAQVAIRKDGRDCSSRSALSVLLLALHDCTVICLRPADAKAFHEISYSCLILPIFPVWVRYIKQAS